MRKACAGMIFLIALTFSAAVSLPADPVPRITKEELRDLLRNPDVIVLDVRIGEEWANSAKKIEGAVREDPAELKSWMKNYPKEKTLVFYCS